MIPREWRERVYNSHLIVSSLQLKDINLLLYGVSAVPDNSAVVLYSMSDDHVQAIEGTCVWNIFSGLCGHASAANKEIKIIKGL